MTTADAERDLSIRQTATAIRLGRVSCLDLVQLALHRIAATEPHLHAWVELDADRALQTAFAMDRDLKVGIDRGLRHGLPVAVKDIVDVAGFPTRCGLPVLQDVPAATADAPVIRRLRDAGAVILGKTVTQEFAAGMLSPPTRNPWDTTRVPGGSSGGSAVAVAVGAAFVAVGSDTGGSIRIPAAAVGAGGFKPTFGDVPTAGVRPLAPSLDTVGPFARTVDDLWIGWHAMRGTTSVPTFQELSLRGIRVGVPRAHVRERLQPGVAAAVRTATDAFASLGAEIVVADWEDAARARAASFIINRVETGASIWEVVAGDPHRLRRLNADLQIRLMGGRMLPSAVADLARRTRLLVRDSMAAHFARHRIDVMLAPTLPAVAVQAADPTIRYDDGSSEPVGSGYTRLTMPFNATGQPVLALPCGFAEGGLPVGLQLAGRPGGEGRLFAIAAAWESATGVTGARLPEFPRRTTA